MNRYLSRNEELRTYYESDQPGKKRWFYRKMNLLSEAEQNEVWEFLVECGHKRPGSATAKAMPPADAEAGRVKWTEDEWERLATFVWLARKNHPEETVLALANKVQPQFPKDRQRKLMGWGAVQPLVDRLKAKDALLLKQVEDAEFAQEHAKELTQKLAQMPTEADVLEGLTDDKLKDEFGPRVLNCYKPSEVLNHYHQEALLSAMPMESVLRHVMEGFLSGQRQIAENLKELTTAIQGMKQPAPPTPAVPKPSPPPPAPPPPAPTQGQELPRLPKITVVGLLGNQQNEVKRALLGRANFNFIDKERKPNDLPAQQDILVVATKFVGHAHAIAARKVVLGKPTTYIEHKGGILQLIAKLRSELPEFA